jgi:DNA-binding NtrC family response regulator/tetratricopeptide (TPR) repeat protein
MAIDRTRLMLLLADRFVMENARQAIDLATGERVLLTISAAGGQTEQRRWALRCDTLQKLHHPAVARLLDYGAIGESQRFEAWCCVNRRQWPPSQAFEIRVRASDVLRACGLTVGSQMPNVWSSPSGPVVLPEADAGYPSVDQHRDDRLPLEARGLVALERRAVSALSELFDTADLRPRVAALWGPDGAGKHTAVVDLARIARLRGFVPVSARLFSTFASLLTKRSLVLIDESGQGLGWGALLQAALRSLRPQILLFVGREETPSVDAVRLEPLGVEALASSVCPAVAGLDQGRVRRVADRSEGWPGRFARMLWRQDCGLDSLPRRLLRASEQPAAYEIEPAASTGTSVHSDLLVAADLVMHRRRLESAVRAVGAGRHAPGERALRQTIGALSRRKDWVHAGEGQLALGSLLVRRGRLREAQATLETAADYWGRAGAHGRLVDVAVQRGVALIELARLDEAETVLSAAIATARPARDGAQRLQATTALARVLFWRGRYEEAAAALQSIGRIDAEKKLPIAALALASRIAVGSRSLDIAVSRANEAADCARQTGDPRQIVEAAYASAFAHLAVGDLKATEHDVRLCVGAARAAHEPLSGLRGRLLFVECLRRSGRPAAATALLARIGKIASTVLPPIVRARFDLLREVVSATSSIDEIVRKHAASMGLEALHLFVRGPESKPGFNAVESIVDHMVELVNLCQTSDDEGAILLEVCRRLRGRIHAFAVAFAAIEGGRWGIIASDGGRIDLSIVERAATAGITVAPHRCQDRIEAAAPVRYGGTIIGVLTARWTVGSAHDVSRAASLLTAAAAASAWMLSAALERRRRPAASGLMELLGPSAAMAAVRGSVDHAAAAPFAVLVEGESGSGKELVARALHRSGPRRDRQFCALNCAALPDELVESELFGHARGAFTGAMSERPGVFEEAHGGTLFLDEVGELSPRAQAKMLRVLQDGELRRIGENAARRIDVRFVSATNRDLRREAEAGRFRFDLLYRLDVIRIVVPPLRERREDIAVLAEHCWREMASRVGSRATLAAATLAALARYDWPGNVRELQNVLASLLVRSPKRGVIPPGALGPQFGVQRFEEAARLNEARRIFEERFVRAALARAGGHRARAATELGVTRQGLTKLMGRLGITE